MAKRDERGWLATLLEVGEALGSSDDLDVGLHRVLEQLEEHHAVDQSTITLVHPESEEIAIHASLGVGRDERRARYKLGEGITGRVIESGKSIVVPEVSREPLFLNR